MAWLCLNSASSSSLSISVVTELQPYLGVISINGLTLHHESLYLRGYCARAVCGSISVNGLAPYQSLSGLTARSRFLGVISVNGLALHHESVYLRGYWAISVSGSDLRKWPGSIPESLYLRAYCAQSVFGSDLSKWPGAAPRVCVSSWLLSYIGIWQWSQWMAWLHTRVSVPQGLLRSVGFWEWSQ